MFERFAIYFMPTGPLGDAGAAWLGWDAIRGVTVAHPKALALNLETLTKTPRKYGFHATLKPPFHLKGAYSQADLENAVQDLARTRSPVELDRLEVSRLGGFLALTPVGDQTALRALAGACVTELDPFRAPASEADLARRRQARLTPEQDAHLVTWGYPYVLDQFRFHMTLTGRTQNPNNVLPPAAAHFDPVLPTPFILSELTLAGQAADGMFHEIKRFALSGQGPAT